MDNQFWSFFSMQPRLCTWLQAEADDVVTASGSVHLGPPTHMYRFQMKLASQLPVAEFVMLPRAHGFQKRPKFICVPTAWPCNNTLQAKTSYSILQDAHDFFLVHCMPQEQKLYLSGYAVGVLDVALQTIHDWLAEHPSVDPALKIPWSATFALHMTRQIIC